MGEHQDIGTLAREGVLRGVGRLTGQSALVIGGSSGIGLAIARAAKGDGATVTIAGRDGEKLDRAAHELGGGVDVAAVDLTDEASVAALFEGRDLDHLAITGPGPGFAPFLEADLASVRADVEAKFWGQYLAARHAAPILAAKGAGSITFMSGAFSQRPPAGASTLAAIQAGLEGLARALAVELGPVRVNAVSPGLTDTPLIRSLFGDEAAEGLYRQTASELPARRVTEPEDVAEVYLMLMRSRAMTGATIYPDGGLTLRG